MLKKKYFLISILIIFILSIGFVSASNVIDSDLNQNAISDDILDIADSSDAISSDQSADLISNSADNENLNAAEDSVLQSENKETLTSNIKPSGKTFNDIQTAVNKAKANDVIELNGTYTSSGKSITVKKSLTFNGVNGATLNAKKLSGIFYVPANATVTFKNIKFINANRSAIYGGSYDYTLDCKVKAIVKNCNFTNNYNDYEGGAIYAPTIVASDSNFTGNYVKEPDCDIYCSSGGGAISANNLVLTNCNFFKNNAQLEGGAIICDCANITNCLFKENFAHNAGAISAKELNLKGSSFISNHVKTSPGYGYPYHGGAVISSKLKATNCIFKSNSVTYNCGYGGAIYGINIDVKNCIFEKNIANYAGAIYSAKDIDEDTYSEGVLKINNCSFKNNTEGTIRASKAIVINGNSSITFKNKTLSNCLKPFSLFKVTANKLTTVYLSGKTMQIKVITSPSSKPAKGLLLLVVAKSSKKTYSVPIKTNSKGIATLKPSKWNKGTYKISVYEAFCLPGSDPGDEVYVKVPGVLKTSTVKINKAKTIVKAPKVKYRYKKSRYFKITLKHKTTKKVMSGIKLKLRIYTGKKYKTYTVKTNKKGVAKFNTKKLKRGKHKVKILSGNKNVVVSKKSSIRIR